jgi:hypothetical protein
VSVEGQEELKGVCVVDLHVQGGGGLNANTREKQGGSGVGLCMFGVWGGDVKRWRRGRECDRPRV